MSLVLDGSRGMIVTIRNSSTESRNSACRTGVSRNVHFILVKIVYWVPFYSVFCTLYSALCTLHRPPTLALRDSRLVLSVLSHNDIDATHFFTALQPPRPSAHSSRLTDSASVRAGQTTCISDTPAEWQWPLWQLWRLRQRKRSSAPGWTQSRTS